MSKIEETRREMYRLLEHLKANPTGVVLIGEFESAMEAHLEAILKQSREYGQDCRDAEALSDQLTEENQVQRQRIITLSEEKKAIQRQAQIYSDGHSHQMMLTQSACRAERESWLEIRDLRSELASAKEEIAFRDDSQRVIEKLRKTIDKCEGRISQLKAWMKAAVRDSQRLRKDRKAFLQTQEENLVEIQRLSAYLDRQEGVPNLAGGSISSKSMPTYRESNSAANTAYQEAKQ